MQDTACVPGECRCRGSAGSQGTHGRWSGVGGGETLLVQVTKNPLTFMGWEPRSRVPPAPAEQSSLLLLLKRERKGILLFQRPPAKRGWGWSRRRCSAPARIPHCSPSSSTGITGITGAKTTGPPGPAPWRPEPNHWASVCTQNKVNLVQSKGMEGAGLPLVQGCNGQPKEEPSQGLIPPKGGGWTPKRGHRPGRRCPVGSTTPSARPCAWAGPPHPPAHSQTLLSWCNLHLEQETRGESHHTPQIPPHPGAGQGQPKSTCNDGRAHPWVQPLPSQQHRVHRAG